MPRIKIQMKPLFIVIALMLGFYFSVQAEDAKEEDVFFEADSYFRYMPTSNVKAMSGKVEIIETDSEASYNLKAFGELPVKFSLGTHYIGIENTAAVELPSRLIGLTSDIETTLPFFNFKETYFRIGISPSFYADNWNFESSAFRIPCRYIIIHEPNDKLTLFYGIAFHPDFYQAKVVPIAGFIYKPNAKLSFNIRPDEPSITYSLNPKLTVFGEGEIGYRQFEVDRGQDKNVILIYKQQHVGAGLKYKFSRFIETSLSAGRVFRRTLKYRDSCGKVNIKDGFYTEFRLEMKI